MKISNQISQLALLGSLFLGACAELPDSTTSMQSFDMATTTFNGETPKFEVDPDCKVHIKKILCVSDDKEMSYDKNCSFKKVTTQQFENLMTLVDQLPPLHKRVMCHLGRIQIQDEIFSIGYASTLRDKNRFPVSSMMGFRSDVLRPTSDKQYLSWKEQLNFGYSRKSDPQRKASPHGVFVNEKLAEGYSQGLVIIIHELNHILDFMNSATNVEWTGYKEQMESKSTEWIKVNYMKSAFARISWGEIKTFYKEKATDKYETVGRLEKSQASWLSKWPEVAKLCFYYCKGPLSPSAIPAIYAELAETDFATSYSTQSDKEDFAEAASFFVFNQAGIPYDYKITGPKGELYFDGQKHYASDKMKAKREWLRSYFSTSLRHRFD